MDALFLFLARRDSFLSAEVEIYIDAITGYKEVAPAVARNLEILLDQADGVPDGVFWIYKVIALKTLEQTGGPEQIPLLEVFVRDKSSYFQTFRQEAGSVLGTSDATQENVNFTDVQAIRTRSKRGVETAQDRGGQDR